MRTSVHAAGYDLSRITYQDLQATRRQPAPAIFRLIPMDTYPASGNLGDDYRANMQTLLHPQQ
jgi:hypothetical protein